MSITAHRILLSQAMALIILIATGSKAIATDCKQKINDQDYAISKAVKLASAIKYGVTVLAVGDSGDHPGYLLKLGLARYVKTLDDFISTYSLSGSEFDYNTECPDGKPDDNCFYCPKSSNDDCKYDYSIALHDDVQVLLFGNDTAAVNGKFSRYLRFKNANLKIDPSEGIACIAKSFDSNSSPREKKPATQLAVALYIVLGSLTAPDKRR